MAAPRLGAAAVFVNTTKTCIPTRGPRGWSNGADQFGDALDVERRPRPNPNNEGWGRVNLASLIITNRLNAPRHYEYGPSDSDQRRILYAPFWSGLTQPLKSPWPTLTFTVCRGNSRIGE